MGKPLTEQQFNTIKAQLRKKSNDIAKVAEASGLKVSTIKAVRRMESWKHYQAYRKAEGEKIKALHKLDKITQSEQLVKKVTAPIKVAKPSGTVTQENIRPTTRIQTDVFDAIGLQLVSLTERVVTLEVAVRKLQHDAIKSDIQERRTFMARFRKGQQR